MAIASIRGTRWRSGFTMLGVVVAVVPVLLILGIGEGVKRDIAEQVQSLGRNLLIVRPGSIEKKGNVIDQFSVLNGYSAAGAFTKADYDAVRQVKTVGQLAPLSLVPGAISVDKTVIKQPFVIGTTGDFPSLMNQPVRHGDFIGDADKNRRVAVLGREAAEQIFGENIPLGRAFDFRGQTFVVRGILEESSVAPFSFTSNFNYAVIIPYDVGIELSGSSAINEMLIRPTEGTSLETAGADITTALQTARGGATDFSILTQAQNLQVANRILTLLTGLISAIAAIALLVSGIGIMNIMLVTVTERMHEIGVRKAIGATKRQIMGQFMAEATLLSLAGGVIGIIAALICEYLISVFTPLQPIITWQMMVLVVGVSLTVGVVFGGVPALKAARKDPIAALRHE